MKSNIRPTLPGSAFRIYVTPKSEGVYFITFYWPALGRAIREVTWAN